MTPDQTQGSTPKVVLSGRICTLTQTMLVNDVLPIERASGLGAAEWRKRDYDNYLFGRTSGWHGFAFRDVTLRKIRGFVIFTVTGRYLTVHRLLVAPAFRRRGIGTVLLRTLQIQYGDTVKVRVRVGERDEAALKFCRRFKIDSSCLVPSEMADDDGVYLLNLEPIGAGNESVESGDPVHPV